MAHNLWATTKDLKLSAARCQREPEEHISDGFEEMETGHGPVVVTLEINNFSALQPHNDAGTSRRKRDINPGVLVAVAGW